MKYIYGDIKEYQTKVVSLELLGKKLCFWVRVVPQLDHPVLVGRGCPLLKELLAGPKGPNLPQWEGIEDEERECEVQSGSYC